MLSIPGNQVRDCDGVTRRELLRIGGAGLLGITLPGILALEEAAKAKWANVEAAYQRLSDEYHVDGDVLRQDLLDLVENLITQGILIRGSNP